MLSYFLASALAVAAVPTALAAAVDSSVGSRLSFAELSSIAPRADEAPVTINVYAHVVARPRSKAQLGTEFYVNRTSMEEALLVLDAALKPADISFKLVNMTWTKAEDLTPYSEGIPGTLFKTKAFKDVYQGGDADLNVYILNAPRGGLGMTRPYSDIKDEYISGVALSHRNIRGGQDMEPLFNESKTLVHEVGHWLGWTTHTPPVNCTASYKNGTGCDPRADCKNFLSYNYDVCRTTFDENNIALFRQYARSLKAGKVPQDLWQYLSKLPSKPNLPSVERRRMLGGPGKT